MLLVYGTAGIVLAVLIYSVTLIGSRNPRTPLWAHDLIVGNVYAPLIVVLIATGIGFFIKFILTYNRESVDAMSLLTSAGLVVACLVLLRSLRIGQRLADYERQTANTAVIRPAAFFGESDPTVHPQPPLETPDGRKAA